MKKLFILSLLAVAALVSCSRSDKATVSINVKDAPDSSEIYVSKLSVSQIMNLDTLKVGKGHLKYEVPVREGAPEFIYLSLNGKPYISLLVSSREDIIVDMDARGVLLSVSGSEESENLQIVTSAMNRFNAAFDSVMTRLSIAVEAQEKAEIDRLQTELGGMYVNQKRKSIAWVYNNINSMLTIPILYHKTSSGLPIFSQLTDAILFERVYDSLSVNYASSPFLVSLADEIMMRKKAMALNSRLSEAEQVDFPEIALTDIDGKQQLLSSLKGKVVLLLFWDIADVKQKQFNTELLSLYRKYAKSGLEVYHVALTADRTAWALQVREQNLPWICVSDPMAAASVAAMSYNVSKLPAMFVISRKADIVAKDLFDLNRLDREIRSLL